MGSAIIPVRGEDQLFAVVRKHRESIKHRIPGDLFKTAAIEVYHKKVEIEAPAAGIIGTEDDLFTGVMKIGSPIGLPQVGDMFQIAAIHIAGKDFHRNRRHKTLLQQVFVFLYGFGSFGPGSPEYQLASVR